jgi:hypothetical protein
MEDRNFLRRALRTPLGEPPEATRNAFRDYVEEVFSPRDPSREYGSVLPVSRDPNAPGSTRFDLRGGLTGDFFGMLAAGGRAMRGQPYNPADITAGMMGMATPSLAARPNPAVLPVFGGAGAQGVGNQMRRAREYLRMGYSPENVYSMTGVFRGPDGQLRFEINDAPAQLRMEALTPGTSGYHSVPFGRNDLTVGQVLNHPELFERYPAIADTPLRSTGFNFNLLGAFDPGSGQMYLGSGKPEDMLSTLLHEIQHNVQHIERFAQGGNPQQFLSPQHNELKRTNSALLTSIRDALEKEGTKFNSVTLTSAINAEDAGTPLMRYQRAALDAIKDHPLWPSLRTALSNDLRITRAERNAYEQYRALPGEREARTVQTRQPLSAGERRQRIPEYDR